MKPLWLAVGPLALGAGARVPGAYGGALRPQAHFSPPKNFMNDPCGCFRDASGLWHLYYQYNPAGLVAGNQHWAHATSRDLYHWRTEHPVALAPPRPDTQAFDGAVVIDANNTSHQ